MDDGPSEPTVDFIPAVCFVRRGVAKERPEKVELTAAEIAHIIEEPGDELESGEDSETEDGNAAVNGMNQTMDTSNNGNLNSTDEYNFDRYDEEDVARVAGIGNIAVLDENIPEADDDSEAEDDIIKPTDNLLLVGHVSDDAVTMEVWVFNEEEESLYSHHDFILPSFPLCIEWFNYDPGSEQPGNLCAIGCMDPVITIWDLDIQDSFEPAIKLGSKGSRRKNKPKYGHKDAVLDLSWNTNFPHILASGSVDKSVILWDLDEGMPHTTITSFEDRIQTINFHPNDAHNLLTGCSDSYVRLFDCRDPESVNTNCKKWKVDSEVEKVVWNPVDPYFFMVGTTSGQLHYVDIRHPASLLWSTKAHLNEISGICFNHEVNNLLTTTSSDGLLKIWKFDTGQIREVYQHDFTLGMIQCMGQSPDDPFTLVLGGEKSPRFRVYNIKNFSAVREVFNLESMETEE